MLRILFAFVLFSLYVVPSSYAERPPVVVGVATVLSGDAAVIGTNLQRTVATYEKRYLRHPLRFVFEDARKSSAEGLAAYKRLIEVSGAQVLIGGTTSNGTMAAAPLINRAKVPLLTPLTGGSNIDNAGEFIFRIGNSDVLNGYQQAELLINRGLTRVALLTEQTEYTSDIAKFFRERYRERGGTLAMDEEFLPETTDFRALITRIKAQRPQALFMSTQSGLAFGLFIKQFHQLGAKEGLEVHTNFLSADNPEARTAAGEAIFGVHYFAPAYDRDDPRAVKFFQEFEEDHGAPPVIGFHTAGTVDALNMLQDYLDSHAGYDAEGFQRYLLESVRNYQGLMGVYSFDADGNADIGFEPAVIRR